MPTGSHNGDVYDRRAMTSEPGDLEELRRLIVAASGAARPIGVDDVAGGRLAATALRRVIIEHGLQIDPYGVRLDGLELDGPIDFGGATIGFPLVFAGCSFGDPFNIERARLHELRLLDCRIPGILAGGVRIDHDLEISGSTITGSLTTRATTSATAAMWINDATIDGQFIARATVIDSDSTRGIQADHTSFGGNVRFVRGFTSNREIRLIGTRIRGSVDFTGATISSTTGRTIDLGNADIDGSVFIVDDNDRLPTVLHGRLDLRHARIGERLLVRSSTIHRHDHVEAHRYDARSGAGDAAIIGTSCVIRGDVSITGSSRLDGALVMPLAQIDGEVRIADQHISNPEAAAVDFSRASVAGNLVLAGSTIEGRIKLSGTRVGSSLDLGRITLSRAPADPAEDDGWQPPHIGIAGQGLRVAKDLRMRRLSTHGCEVWMRSAEVGGDLDLRGATLSNPASQTLSLLHVTVHGVARLNRFTSTGLVSITDSTIHGRLLAEAATITGTTDPSHPASAFTATGTRFDGGMLLDWTIDGGVDLTNATATIVQDDPTRWGTPLTLTGFTYQRFARLPGQSPQFDEWNVDARLAWLDRQQPLHPAPYDQLAAVYRAAGRRREADRIALAGARRTRIAQRHSTGRRNRLSRWLYEMIAGSGYRPERALYLLLGLFVAVAVTSGVAYHDGSLRATDATGTVYTIDGPIPRPGSATTAAHPGACGAGAVNCFHPALFAADTIVPIIDLHQRDQWHAVSTGHLVWFNVATALGWALSTVAALSFTKLSRSNV